MGLLKANITRLSLAGMTNHLMGLLGSEAPRLSPAAPPKPTV